MNKKLFLIFILFTLLIGCKNSEIRSDIKKENTISNLREYDILKANLTPKRKIIIGKVKNYTRFGTQRTDTITKDILASEFSNSGRFTVLEREDLDSVMEELAFSSNLGENSLFARQRFLDTDFVVIGSVTKYNLNTVGNKSLFSKSKEQRAEAVVELKVIDVLNGKTWIETGEGSSSVKFGTILGTGTYGSYGNLEEEAFRAAVIQGVEKIINKIDSLPWSAAVVKKDGNKIIINAGIDNNLKIGTEVEVYKQGEAIKYKGEFLGYEETLVGTAVVNSYIGNEAASLKYEGNDFSLPAIVKLK